ncbi:PAS domain S-box protein [Janthinobacterium sp. B9-8]|uniref:PAS domain S-box protein n=1 Tax=Janthinobacterium sp. B9-8 TaxID=1236179 RepID=UPI00069C75E1|nr:PAS domain S-box protein [Janthinobacterium sp. B9-8]AMC35104.1 hybrid sensor histidine kinase/response regulator [Janthinobacterium sp. B9-8]
MKGLNHYSARALYSKRHLLLIYLLAIILPLLMLWVRSEITVTFGEQPLLILFILPIIISAYLGGFIPGLLSTLIAAACTAYFLPPIDSFAISTPHDLMQWGMLLINGLLLSFFSEFLHRSRRNETERWREMSAIQDQLLQSELRFQATFEQAAMGIALVSPNGQWLRVNRRLCQITGYSQDELLSLTFQDITHPADLQDDQHFVEQMLAGQLETYAMQKRYLCKGGEITWVNLTVALAWKKNGEPDYFISVIEDIQARKQAEAALKESEFILKEAQRLARVGSWSWDIASNTHLWSEEVYHIYGRDLALPPAVFPEVQHYFSAKSWIELVKAVEICLADGTAYSCDAEVIRHDGNHRWITARGKVKRDQSGKIIELHGTIQDITERKRAEIALINSQNEALEKQGRARLAALNLMEDAMSARSHAEISNAALRESEQRLLMAQEGAHVGIWDWDLSNHQIYWSPECARLYDVAANTPITIALWRSKIYPVDLARIDARLKNRPANEEAFEVEFRIRQNSGEIRWLVSKGRAQYTPYGKAIRISGIALDITKNKQNEEQLRKLFLAVEQSPENIIITDADLCIDYVNTSFVQTSGYDRDEVIGQPAHILQSGHTPEATYAALNKALLLGVHWQGEFINRRKNGDVYTVLASVSPIRQDDGKITHYLGIQEDITEKKRLSVELDRHRFHLEELVSERTIQLAEAREKAESANHAKSAFLANMSHEIRTPMNAILGLTHLLRRDGVTPHQAERLSKINNAAQHLMSVINDILDLSKIEAGRLELEQSDFSLIALFDNVCTLINDAALDKGLNIETDTGRVPAWLHGDATRLRQALLNYASNAIKFTEQGHIILRARVENEQENSLLLRFEVEDTGIGVNAEQASRLFQNFEQADVSTTRKYGGTGLGLAITRRLAERMCGEAGVRPAAGQGSIFWFTAVLTRGISPQIAPVELASGQMESELRNHAGAQLLLVEDNDINLEVILDLLNESGLILDTAVNGQEALEKAKVNHYDLILMDIQMPVMDGLEATIAIRALPNGKNIPIIALTASAFDENKQACEAAGANGFISKPVNPEALFEVLLKWLPQCQITGSVPAPDASRAKRASEHIFYERELAELASHPGLNITEALERLKGNAAKYLDLLRRFLESHAGDMTLLEEHLLKQNNSEVLLITHTLKGAAAVLSIESVASLAEQLEFALHNKAPAAERDRLLHAINHELTQLDSVLNPPPVEQTYPLPQLLTKLENLLSQNDTAAIPLFERHAEQFFKALGTGVQALARQIGQFNFETALDTLHSLIAAAHLQDD